MNRSGRNRFRYAARFTALGVILALTLSACLVVGARRAENPPTRSVPQTSTVPQSPDTGGENNLGSATAGDITVSMGWVAAPTQTSTAAYLTIANAGSKDDALVSVLTPAAGMVQMHTTTETDSGASAMKQVDKFTIPAGGQITLQPGGDHLMVMGIRRAMGPGDTVPFTLRFSSGTTMTLTLPVRDRTDPPTTTPSPGTTPSPDVSPSPSQSTEPGEESV